MDNDNISIHLMLNKEEVELLDDICEKTFRRRSDVIKLLIHKHYNTIKKQKL